MLLMLCYEVRAGTAAAAATAPTLTSAGAVVRGSTSTVHYWRSIFFDIFSTKYSRYCRYFTISVY